MSLQRRRGQIVKIYPTKIVTDSRGNESRQADMDGDPLVLHAAAIPQRSSKAEVPGQQQINVVRLIVNAELPGVDLWSRVEYLDSFWDVAAPPAYHHGPRRLRHWSLDIRRRPSP